ncbi:nonribosomal peptide synthetase [Ilyonectria robusta]
MIYLRKRIALLDGACLVSFGPKWFLPIMILRIKHVFGQHLCTVSLIWLLTITTASIALSWVFLRKVPVQAEILSDHAIRLHFDYTVPVNGSFTRLSKHPLLEWHSFATIPTPEPANNRPKGLFPHYLKRRRLTKAMIQEELTHIWTRGVPTCGVMRITTLFNRIILIATGSGIGPMLGHIQSPYCRYS